MESTEFYQLFKGALTPILFKVFHNTEGTDTPKLFMKPVYSDTKTRKDTHTKEN